MPKFARIENGKVMEIIDFDPKGIYHPDLTWMAAPDACLQGWVVWNGQVIAPDDYRILREAAYPDYRLYLDAMAKKASSDPVVQAAGDKQLSDFYNECLAVKLQYPKPV